jgi:hypothetical protein
MSGQARVPRNHTKFDANFSTSISNPPANKLDSFPQDLCIVVFCPFLLAIVLSDLPITHLVSSNSCSILIVYCSVGKLFVLTHLKDVLCLPTQDVTILRN